MDIKVLKKSSSNQKPKLGNLVTVHYTGYLPNGTIFDSSVRKNKPFSFRIGLGQVIDGWDRGLLNVNKGDVVKLTIPPNLAYGNKGAGGVIPPNATLVFEIQLLDIKN